MNRHLPALLLFCLLLLSGCSGPADEPSPSPSATQEPTPEPAAEEHFTLPWYPSASLHPITGDNRSNLVIASLVYETLFVVDDTFTARPGLALNCATENGLTHVITLRTDAVFSDGSPLTARDAAASLELARTSALYASRLSLITSVRAEEGQVIVTTSAPHGSLALLLDIPVVQQGDGDRPLGSGPYQFSGGEDSLSLQPNPHWPRPEQLPAAQVSLLPITRMDMLVSSFDSREISLVHTDLTGTNALGFSGDYEVWDYPTSVLQYVGFNTAGGPCRDAALRSALSCCFDRAFVAFSLLAHHGQAAVLPFSPSSGLYSQALADELAGPPGELTQRLTDAGHTLNEEGVLSHGRRPLALTLLVSADNSARLSIARYLAARLEEAGVAVTLRELPWEDFLRALERREFDLYLAEVKLTADFDLTALLHSRGNLNYGGWASGETDALLAAFRAAAPADRPTAAADLCRQIAGQAPILPLTFKNHSILTHWGALSSPAVTLRDLFSR